MATKNAPRNYQGTRDWLEQDMYLRQFVIGTLTDVFQRFGFVPLETPIIELEETLLGKYGDEGNATIYRFQRGADRLGLRYDMTVPLARVVAQYKAGLVLPYRRYTFGPVFRADKPQKGRFRQFWQCDFDNVGVASPIADAEVVAVNYFALSKLGFPRFVTRVCDRKLLDAMARAIGAENQDQVLAMLRGWDKLQKATRNQIAQELKETGIADQVIDRFNETTDCLTECGKAKDPIAGIAKLFPESETVSTCLETLRHLVSYVEGFGVPKDFYRIDPTLARGLAYYTGPIFETEVADARISSITGGGRFDNLIETLGGPSLPATGSSFGLERLTTAMETLGIAKPTRTKTQVFVAVFNPTDTRSVLQALSIGKTLRENGLNVEVYEGNQGIGKQMQIADRRDIPFAVFAGDEELARGTVVVKNLMAQMTVKDKSTNQREIPERDLVGTLRSLLKSE